MDVRSWTLRRYITTHRLVFELADAAAPWTLRPGGVRYSMIIASSVWILLSNLGLRRVQPADYQTTFDPAHLLPPPPLRRRRRIAQLLGTAPPGRPEARGTG